MIKVYVLFTTKPYSTHTKMRLVVVFVGLCCICRFHWDWRSNHCLNYDCRVKIWDRSLKRSVKLFGKWYYHFPNSVTLRFSERAKIFTRWFPYRYWLDLENQWNLHNKQKANQYTDHSYSACVWCVFLQDFTKHVDSKIAPRTRAIVNLICYSTWIMLACHIALSNRFFYALLNWSVYFVYYKTVLDTHQMRLVFVLFGLCLICLFHWDWRANRCLYYDRRVKILDRSLSY